MGRGEEAGPPARKFAAAEALPKGRVVHVRSKDGLRLHTEVFGPEDGYPIVLAHGITCAIRVWAYQIADLANDYRVIAFDHRGHGRSAVPRAAQRYSLDILAADLDSVLEATLAPGERAVIAGHSMGGIAISVVGRALSRPGAAARRRRRTDQHHHRRPAAQRATAAGASAAGRRPGAGGGHPAQDLRCRAASARGGSAEPAFRRPRSRWAATPTRRSPSSSTSCSPLHRPPAAAAGPARWLTRSAPEHIGLTNLTVPTLVIGSAKDRLLPIGFVAPHREDGAEPRIVRRAARRALRDRRAPGRGQQAPADADRVGHRGPARHVLAGQGPVHLVGCALTGSHRAVEEAGPFVGGLGARPEDAVDRFAQPGPVRRP